MNNTQEVKVQRLLSMFMVSFKERQDLKCSSPNENIEFLSLVCDRPEA